MLNSLVLIAATGISILSIMNQAIELMEWLATKPLRRNVLIGIIAKVSFFTLFLCYASMEAISL